MQITITETTLYTIHVSFLIHSTQLGAYAYADVIEWASEERGKLASYLSYIF